MAIAGAVYVRIVSQYSDKGSKAAQKDIQRTAKKIDQFAKKIAKSFAIGAAAASAFALKIGIDAVKGAAEDQKAQTSLAIAIRNTTSATEEAITANTKFLDTLELQVAIDNNELIPALQKLVTATGDLSQAQNLLILSTDIAAASGKDLSIVSAAISRAMGGNFTALTKLGLPIDKVALKQGNLNKILDDFADISKGQASAAANTYSGRLKVLALSYNQVLDKLGVALMPLVMEFTNYLTKPGGLLDALDEWIETNETELQESLKGVTSLVKLLIDNGDNLTKMLDILVSISGFLNTSILGTIKIGEVFLAAGVFTYLGIQFTKMTKAMSPGAKEVVKITDDAAKGAKGASDAVKKVGGGFDTTKTKKSFGIVRTGLNAVSTRAKVAIGLIAAVAGGTLLDDIKDFFAGGNDAELLKQMQAQTKIDFQNEQATKEKARLDKIVYDNSVKYQTDLNRQAIIDAAKRAAEVKKQEALEAKILKRQTALRKSLGITGKNELDEEKDIKQLNAAILLQKRQENAKKADMDKLELLKSMFKTQDDLAKLELVRSDILVEYNKNLRYQNDLMVAYQDDMAITADEIKTLSIRWGISAEEVEKYSTVFLALVDEKIDSTDIQNVARAFNIGTAEAKKYLEAVLAIKHGTLDIETVNRLATEWKVLPAEALKYIQYVAQINNPTATLSAAGVESIKKTWGLTNDELSAYLNQIGLPFDYDDSMLSGVDALIAKLKTALELIKQIQGGTTTATTTTTTTTASDEAARAAAEAAARAVSATAFTPTIPANASITNPFNPDSEKISAQILQAQKETLIALRESEEKGTAISFLLKEQIDTITDSLSTNSFNALGDERARLNTMRDFETPTASTFDPARFRAFESGDTIVNVTVQGSVTSEQDLVTTIRNGLLTSQYNGNSINLQAI